MADNTSSVAEHQREMEWSIRAFLPDALRSPWIEQGRARAAQQGPYTRPLDENGLPRGQVVFYPDRVEWHFVSNALTDNYTLVVPSSGTWKLLHDRYGTGENQTVLRDDDNLVIQGLSAQKLWAISSDFQGQISRYRQVYLGGPPANPPMPAQKFQWKKEYTWIAIGVGVAILLGSCLLCCIGSSILGA